MPETKIALEWKYEKRPLSRPTVDEIVGNAYRNGYPKVIIYCRKAAKTAKKAAQEWKEKGIEVIISETLKEYDSKTGYNGA